MLETLFRLFVCLSVCLANTRLLKEIHGPESVANSTKNIILRIGTSESTTTYVLFKKIATNTRDPPCSFALLYSRNINIEYIYIYIYHV